MYFKIDKTGQDEVIKKCFNNTWYNACEGKVLLLKEANESDTDVLKVTGSDNKWEITDSKGNKFKDDKCDSGKNKWIIVKVITLNGNTKEVGDSFIFYVDEIKSVERSGVFERIECYSIKIIAANTSAVESMYCMFYEVYSMLEKDGETGTGPGLIGLDKLNVENVTIITNMFSKAIHKQTTLDQLGKWRFSGKSGVSVTNLFYSTVKGLAFSVLNDWSKSTNNGTVFFVRQKTFSIENVFVDNNNKKDFKPPNWYYYIGEF